MIKNVTFFPAALLEWDRSQNTRKMPWKGEKDPYKIWISEIILQQTRVAQGMDYYNRFIRAFPDIRTLAGSPEKKVYKLWEGLGYYSRCKNLITTAKCLYHEHGGKFPARYEDLLSLKGIGTYTASAIASFAFNQPYAVLDGNVFRVLSRFFGLDTPVNTAEGKKFYAGLAQKLLGAHPPALYNQAIMDFGAILCKPAQPLCASCPLQKRCVAFSKDRVAALPVKKTKINQKERFFNYLIVENEGNFYIKKRTERDIWQNLYEFVLVESGTFAEWNALGKEGNFSSLFGGTDFKITRVSGKISQKLTHQLISGRFFHIEIKKSVTLPGNYRPVSKKQLKTLPFPKFITSYLKDKNVPLNLI